ncbi:MAG TPA: hypothetical protein ENI17_14055 [Pseudomonas xinjiangensis]|uniref:Uncharacterized protein n=2 Tax=root TaxID=1 RepID=A0A7V1FS68_9GAMM|nr:hypothetical protein [Halopseudomonas xinjiangensis]HEC48730.1 hypothetical protein [Halopseudomonas xinjiangensis]
MRRLLMFIAAVAISAPVLASNCPADMAKIDEMMKTNPPADEDVREQVLALRAEGEELHKAGEHEESLKVLDEAMERLKEAE